LVLSGVPFAAAHTGYPEQHPRGGNPIAVACPEIHHG
jgi:hypothetical protein